MGLSESTQRDIAAGLARLGAGGPVALAVASNEHAALLDNWLCHVHALGIGRTLVVAMDEPLAERLRGAPFPIARAGFDGTYPDFCFRRSCIWSWLADQGVEFIQSDTDAVWLRDPVSEYAGSAFDLLCSQGTLLPRTALAAWGFVLCTGFFWARATAAIRDLFRALLSVQTTIRCDQSALNTLLLTSGTTWSTAGVASYQLEHRGHAFTCFRQPVAGCCDSLGLRLVLLPHHRFPRKQPGASDAIVRHVLRNDVKEQRIALMREAGCWRLDAHPGGFLIAADPPPEGALGRSGAVFEDGRSMGRRTKPIPVLCAGLQSSGSTWLFNVVIELLRASSGSHSAVVPFFANTADAFPEFDAAPEYLVVKTHAPARSLRFLAEFAAGPVLMSVRDPRDAVASLMSRFRSSFDIARERVVQSAAALVALSRSGRVELLHYETRFFEQQHTVARIADFLKLELAPETLERIGHSLSRDAVSRKIAELVDTGVFGPEPDADAYDRQTHWHPGHLGPARVGQYSEVLSAREQASVILLTREFCRHFGYPMALPSEFPPTLLEKQRPYLMGEPVAFRRGSHAAAFLGGGWSRLEANLVWAIGESSDIRLDVGDLPAMPEQYRLRLTVSPFKVKARPVQRLSVLLNGEPLGEARLTELTTLEFAFQRALIAREEPIAITLVHPDAMRPSEHLPGNPDRRLLAIALRSLEIGPA